MSKVEEGKAGQGQYNAPQILVSDRDQTKENVVPVNTSVKIEAPELFRNLRTVILARDIGDTEKVNAAKTLIHNLKEGSYVEQTFAHQIVLELLTHERLRGR